LRVYNIGDFRVKVKPDTQGFTFKDDPDCHHRHLVYSEEGQTIECEDCKKQVTSWWAFLKMCRQFKRLADDLERIRKTLEDEKARNLTHSAAIKVEDAWRRRKYQPTCPHCVKPITPMDNFGANKTRNSDQAKPMKLTPMMAVVGNDDTEGES
jgi:hypothetical protein